MQMVFYFNTNIWDNNPALTEQTHVVREELPWQQGHLAGPAVWGEWWGSTWRERLKDDKRAGGQSLTLLSDFHQLKVSYLRSFINPAFWIQMVCVNCQGHGGPKEKTLHSGNCYHQRLHFLVCWGGGFVAFFKEGRVEFLSKTHLWVLACCCFSQRAELFAPGEGSHALGLEKGDLGCSLGCWKHTNWRWVPVRSCQW